MTLNQAFIQKRDKALQIAVEKGIRTARCQPLLFRLLWKSGVAIRPPHYLPTSVAALLTGCEFALFLWLLMTLFFNFSNGAMPAPFLGRVLFAALIYGVGSGFYYARTRRANRLPDWSEIR